MAEPARTSAPTTAATSHAGLDTDGTTLADMGAMAPVLGVIHDLDPLTRDSLPAIDWLDT